MGPEFHRFSDLLSSLLSYIFLWISVFSTACFLASVFWIPFLVVLHYHRPDQAFPCCFASLGGLHVEHLKDGTASRLRGGHTRVRLLFFLVVLNGSAHGASLACHSSLSTRCSCLPGLALSASRTCWEAAAAQHLRIWYVGTCSPCALGIGGSGHSLGRAVYRLWRWLSGRCLFCLRKSSSEVPLTLSVSSQTLCAGQ